MDTEGKGGKRGSSNKGSVSGESSNNGSSGSGKSMKQLMRLLAQYTRTRYRRKWRNRERFERWQERQVLKRLRQVSAESPYYRELWGSKPLTAWRSFPIIDKAAMMANFDRLNTAGIRKEEAMELALAAERTRDFKSQIGDITVGLSSGTSGSRGLFLVSENEQASWAGAMLAKVLPGPLWQEERIAFFLRANSNLYETVRGGRLQFEYFDLLIPIAEQVERLNTYQPGIWVAPPSMLRLLATERRQGRLTSLPHRILSVAEVLDPLDERYIAATFGLPVHQVYQCTEGFLACTCEHGTLHLNEDLVHIEKEYLSEEVSQTNASNPATPCGRRFVPIITDFSRTTQPIIRYRLYDVLTEAAAPCPCGSVLTAIERIEGRCDDVFYLEPLDGEGVVPVFPDYLARAVLAASAAIEEYRVLQLAAGQVRVELLLADGAEQDKVEQQVTAVLDALWHRLRCRAPQLTYAPYSFETCTRKLRRVERSWRLDEPRSVL